MPFVLGPLEFKSLVLEFPPAPYPVLPHLLELPVGVLRFGQSSIDIGLFDMLEGRPGIVEYGFVVIIGPEVVGLGSGHPFRDILAVLTRSR